MGKWGNEMKDYKLLFKELERKFENYEIIKEKEIEKIKETNEDLQKQLGILYNIAEVSKYISSNIRDEKLVLMINDMIVGLLGVTNSCIYIYEDGVFKVKVSTVKSEAILTDREEACILKGEDFLINDDFIRKYDNVSQAIKSVLGIPIKIRDNYTGYIIVEHTLKGYLTTEHKMFLSSISNQIAVALENSKLYRELKEAVIKDPLLGIYNRKYFFERAEEFIKAEEKDYAIVMIDLDGFKKFNDTYGHQFGDEVLIQTSNVIKSRIRKSDIFARYGGEELIIFLKNINDYKSIYEKIDNIRKAIEENYIVMGETKAKVTASFGLAFHSMYGDTIADVISRADELLYNAKANGKNKVCINDKLLKKINKS